MTTIKILDSSFSPELFNSKAIHPLQSWQWGEARKKMGIKVIRFGQFQGENLTSVFQMTIHPLVLNYAIGYLPRSIIPPPDFIRFLAEFGKKNSLVFVKIEPYESNLKFEVKNLKLTKSPHPLFPVWTQILNLTGSEEALLRNMKQKTRYNIKLAQKKGVTVKEMSNSEGFEIFQKLYFETCKRQKYFGHSKKYHEVVWNNLKNNIAHILIAFYQKKPLAAYELFHFNNIFFYTYGGTSSEDRNVMAANLLMWEAIRLGKKLEAKQFDMWGSLPPNYDQKNPWAGFTRFKEGYGTRFVEMVSGHDLVISIFYYQVYNFFHKIRQIYLIIKGSL